MGPDLAQIPTPDRHRPEHNLAHRPDHPRQYLIHYNHGPRRCHHNIYTHHDYHHNIAVWVKERKVGSTR